jgi:hypothetical protein
MYRRGKNPQEMKTSSWEVTTRTSEGVKTIYRGGKNPRKLDKLQEDLS